MISDKYRELLALTQLYLFQEHSLSDRLFDDRETFEYFRKHAQQQKLSSSNASMVTTADTAVSKPQQSLPISANLQQSQAPTNIKPEPLATQKEPSPPQPPKASVPSPKPKLPEAAPSPSISAPPEQKKLIQESAANRTPLTIAPPPPPKEIELNDLRKIMSEKLPHIQLLDQIPHDRNEDHLASDSSGAQKSAEVVILTLNEVPSHQAFLMNIAKALEIDGLTTKVCSAEKIEQERGWDSLINSDRLRLVIANSGCLYAFPEMQKHHRETQKTARHHLGRHPMLILSDISFYLAEPSLKQSLWMAIKEHITWIRR